jgi:glycosyltransferase involved in cell wall biosynthesis
MTSPVVSIVTATFNRAGLLPRTWRSITEQSVPLEWILVDDASTDSTPVVAESFGDPRIVFLRQDHNQGCNVARNAGVRVSRGRFIIFLDSDDELVPHALQKAVRSLETAPPYIGAVLMIAKPTFTQRQNEVLPDGVVLNEEDLVIKHRLQRDHAVIYKREVFCNQMFPEEYRDANFVVVFGISRRWNYLVVNIPLTLIHRQNDNLSLLRNLTKRSSAIARGWETVICNHAAILQQNAPAQVRIYMKVLYRYAVAGDWRDFSRVCSEFRVSHPGCLSAAKATAMATAGMIGRYGGEYIRLVIIKTWEEGIRSPTPRVEPFRR